MKNAKNFAPVFLVLHSKVVGLLLTRKSDQNGNENRLQTGNLGTTIR